MFQSAPRERGERICGHLSVRPRPVSIRAPRAGRKVTRVNVSSVIGCFNPRPASGAKVAGEGLASILAKFQSAPRERGERQIFGIIVR